MVFNLRTVESAFTRKNIVLDARSIQCIHQSFFCFIPSCVVTDTFFRTCCNLVGNIGKAVVGVNLLNELGVSGAFGKNLIFCTEDVPIVLSETAERIKPCREPDGSFCGRHRIHRSGSADRGRSERRC